MFHNYMVVKNFLTIPSSSKHKWVLQNSVNFICYCILMNFLHFDTYHKIMQLQIEFMTICTTPWFVCLRGIYVDGEWDAYEFL